MLDEWDYVKTMTRCANPNDRGRVVDGVEECDQGIRNAKMQLQSIVSSCCVMHEVPLQLSDRHSNQHDGKGILPLAHALSASDPHAWQP